MLHLDPADAVCNATIEILARSPGITVADLHAQLGKQKVKVTLQHVYRVVTKMVEAQVILKRKRTLSLNLLWLSYIELFAQGAREKLLKSRDLPSLSELKNEGRTSFTAHSLHEVQILWHHLLIHLNTLVPETQERVLHKYYSHAYWLVRPDADLAFYEKIAKHIDCYWLIGNEAFLDLQAQRDYKDIFSIAVTDRPTFPNEGYLLNVFGDYVIECMLPTAIADHFALLFRSVRSEDEWKPELLEALFHLHGAFTVTVWRSSKRAEELRGKIEHLMPKALLRKRK